MYLISKCLVYWMRWSTEADTQVLFSHPSVIQHGRRPDDSRLQCETYLYIYRATIIPTHTVPYKRRQLDNDTNFNYYKNHWMWNIIKNTCSICKHELIAHTNIINMHIYIVLIGIFCIIQFSVERKTQIFRYIRKLKLKV